jgi:hypothetical protein
MHDDHDSSDSDEETLEGVYDDEEDADAEADMDDDALLTGMTPGQDADNATEDGDDVCVALPTSYSLSIIYSRNWLL